MKLNLAVDRESIKKGLIDIRKKDLNKLMETKITNKAFTKQSWKYDTFVGVKFLL